MSDKSAFGRPAGDAIPNAVTVADITGVPLSDHQTAISQMSGANSSTDWLKGFAITEAAGAAVGGIGGAGMYYGLARGIGSIAQPFLRGVTNADVEDIAQECARAAGWRGAVTGLVLAGAGYGLYKGYKWLKKPDVKNSLEA